MLKLDKQRCRYGKKESNGCYYAAGFEQKSQVDFTYSETVQRKLIQIRFLQSLNYVKITNSYTTF